MKVQIEDITATEQSENLQVIGKCINAIKDSIFLEDAFVQIQEVINTIDSWKCGRGGQHIWVSNSENQRLLLITE